MRGSIRIGGALLLVALVGCNFQTQPPGVCSLAVADSVIADSGRSARLSGSLYSSTAPLTTTWKVYQGSRDASSEFRLEWTAPGPDDLSWDLEEQAKATLRVLTALPDTYTLTAILVDGDGVTLRNSVGFRVHPAAASAFGISSFGATGSLSTDTSADSLSLTGLARSGSPPMALAWKVLRGADDVSSLFRLDWIQPTTSSLSWDLASQAKARLRNLSAPADSYQLAVVLSDGKSRSDTARSGFRVGQSCSGSNCDSEFPMTTSFTGMTAQAGYYSVLSVRTGYPDRTSNPLQAPDSLDLVFRSIDGTLSLLSPAADASWDTAVARWSVRNSTVIATASSAFPASPTLREVMAGLGNSTSQSQTAIQGRTYLLRLASGSVGWMRIDSIMGRADSSVLSITFASPL
jgi:hypothetical protein